MDLNGVKVFIEVARARSFTRAADILRMPKSTVSRRVSELEETLGARLLQRTTRKLKLTDAGVAYYERCARALSELEEAKAAVAKLQEEPRGTLRVTAPVDFGEAFLGDLVIEYMRRYPEARVDMVLTGRVVDLVDEGFDIAVRVGKLADSSLVARKLGVVRGLLVASPEYLEVRGEPSSPDALAEHDCIIFGDTHMGRTWRLLGPRGAVDVPVTGRGAVDHYPLVYKAALAGLGIAVTPTFLCAADLRAGRLVHVLPHWAPPTSPIQAVYPTTRHLSAKVRAFLDMLRHRMTPPPWAMVT